MFIMRLTFSIVVRRKLVVKCFLCISFFTLYYIFHAKYVILPPGYMRHFENKHSIEQYDSFDFERENWTVRMKVPILNEEARQKLCVLQEKEKVVKRIIHLNSSVENLGCTNLTRHCDNAVRFDSKNMVRMKTPPCCRDILLSMLKHFTQEFRRLKVGHFLVAGGVLGWYRYRDIIPYDYDLDIFVDERFWNTDLMKRTIKKISAVNSYDVIVQYNGNKLWIAYSKINRNHIDMWPYKKTFKQNEWKVSYPTDTSHPDNPYSTIFPLKNTSFSGIPVYIPNKPFTYLNELYGKGNWEREISCQHVKDGKCLEYPATIYRLFGIY